MRRATDELIASGAASRALKAGDKAPAFTLKDAEGKVVSSADQLEQGPLIVSFHQGVWRPNGNMELQALQATLAAFEAAGAKLVAISPPTARSSRKSMRQNALGFPILSDPGNGVAAAFGLRFAVPDDLAGLYKRLKKDLPADQSWMLTIPARYVIGRDGTNLYAEVNPDYTRRPKPEDMLPAVRQAVA